MTAARDYQVFARRFRPATFAEVVGQEVVTRTLANAVASGRLAQAYLFAGPRGVGKTSVARILAKALNCAHGPTITPCGSCDNCLTIAAGNDTDVLEIDGASHGLVEDIRRLNERIRFAPAHSRYKVYIIDEVHSISGQAFNALLKTLEEPPDHTLFVFATTRIDKVPETIASRCQRFIFRRVRTADIEAKLARIAAAEGITADAKALNLIARRASGSMRDAESLFDQVIAFAGEKLTARDVERTLGLVAAEAVEALMAAVLAGDGAAALRAVDELAREGADLTQASHQAVEYLRDLLVLAAAPEDADLVDVSGEELEKERTLAALHSPSVLMNLISVFLDAAGPMARVFPPRLVLEYAALKAARIRNLLPVEELLAACEGAEFPPRPSAAVPAAAASPAVAPAAEPVTALAATWQKILAQLAKADRVLHAHVSRARPIECADGVLRIGFPDASRASAGKADEPKRRAVLEKVAGEVLGEEVKVRVEVEEGAGPAAPPDGDLFGASSPASEIKKKFGGEVVEEK